MTERWVEATMEVSGRTILVNVAAAERIEANINPNGKYTAIFYPGTEVHLREPPDHFLPNDGFPGRVGTEFLYAVLRIPIEAADGAGIVRMAQEADKRIRDFQPR